jgi:hypothetical protein
MYNHKFIILIIVLLILSFINSCREKDSGVNTENEPTEIKGNISGTLSVDNNPFYVVDNLYVDSLNTLTIEPGVKLFFYDSTGFEIRGKLTSIGEPGKFIIFTSLDQNWRGIKIINSSENSTIRYSIIEKIYLGDQDSSEFGGVEVNQSSVTIQNCIFRNNYALHGGGLVLLNAASIITNNIFRDNEATGFGGALLSVESTSQIINNTFFQNYCFNHGGALVIMDPVDEDIQNNIFYDNLGGLGDPRISIASGDTLNCNIQYNFLAFDEMDPKFISDEDLHLLSGSPCIDAGNPDSLYNDKNGTQNDQGSYGGPLGNW